jgi:hypothetical protein
MSEGMRSGAVAFLLGFALAALFGKYPAWPHDSWINRGGYKEPGTDIPCCGEGDCVAIDAKHVKAGRGGYWISGFQAVDGKDKSYTEIVPFTEAQPSPDGLYWRCKRPDGTRRCFFSPNNGS